MVAGGFKTFTAGEVLTAADTNDYLMQGVLVFGGTAARGSAVASPVHGQVAFLTDSDTLTFYDGTDWSEITGGAGNADFSDAATGTYTDGGIDYKYKTYTGSGTLTITKEGLCDVLVVGGGGPGGNDGNDGNYAGGGGGAGGYIESLSLYVSAASYTISIGAGGAATADLRANELGSGSAFGSILAAPGGGPGGGVLSANTGVSAKSGGSGGGSYGASAGLGQGAAGQTIFGNSGGFGSDTTGGAGGGGGANAAGSNASGSTGGAGGAGKANSFTGSSVTRAGGGGGGGTTGGAAGAGGGGAGGNAGGSAGSANTGGGGGGSSTSTVGGAGGSGVVIVRVRTN